MRGQEMSDSSYAVFQKSYSGQPTLAQVEQFCFDARTRGAGDKTKVRADSSYDYGSMKVEIPEAEMTTPYAAPAPRFPAKRGIPTWAWGILLVLAIVLGLFV